MSTISCKKAEEWIVTHLDEGLDERKLQRLEDHVRGCTLCQTYQAEMKQMLEAVAQDVPEDPGEYFWKTYDSSLEARLNDRKAGARSSGWTWTAAGALVAASLALVVVLTALKDPAGVQRPGEQQMVSLIEELEYLYGPVDFDYGYDDSIGELKTASADVRTFDDLESSDSWFEVEEEPNHLLL